MAKIQLNYKKPIAGETPAAFHAFCHYRDMPRHERSIRKAFLQHQHECLRKSKVPKDNSYWSKWSAKNQWVKRSEANDVSLLNRRRLRKAHQLDKAQDRASLLSKAMIMKIARRLEKLDEQDIPVSVLDRWLKTLTEIETKALGHDESLMRGVGEGGKVEVKFVLPSGTTKEEYKKREERQDEGPGDTDSRSPTVH